MKRLILFALLGGLSLATPAQTVDNEVRIHGYQIDLPARVDKLYTGDFETFVGAYDLSNGDTLTLQQRGRHMYARVGNGERKELCAASDKVFVALDRQLKISLREEDGDVGGEVLMVVPANVANAGEGPTIRVASLR